MVMNQGWPAHQGWIPYQIGQSVCNGYNCPISQSIYNRYNSPAGQSVYNEVIARPACQSTMAIIFNIRPANGSINGPASRFKTSHWPDPVAHVRWGILKQGGQSEMGKVTEGAGCSWTVHIIYNV